MDIDLVEDLQYAIDWYREVVPQSDEAKGPFKPRPRTVESALAAIRSAIHPLQLSRDIEWFWTTWNGAAIDGIFDVMPGPSLNTPESALGFWQDQLVGQLIPWNLFPVAYESHGFVFAELGVADPDQPAPLWQYYYGDEFFELRYPSLAALFRTTAEAIEVTGVPVPSDYYRADAAPDYTDRASFDRIRKRALVAAGLGDHQRQVHVEDARRWPAEWRHASGIADADTQPLGATHTVAEFLEAALAGPTTARLQGMCPEVMAGGTEDTNEGFSIRRFSDATGSMGVALPSDVVPVGTHRERPCEIEVHWSGPVGPIPPDPSRELLDAAMRQDQKRVEALQYEMMASFTRAVAKLPRVSRMVGVD